MIIIDASSGSVSEDEFQKIITTLNNGGVIICPTETVYGLICCYGKLEAKKRIFMLKNRPKNKPLQCLIANRKMISQFNITIPPLAKKMMTKFFPGPLTIVIEDKSGETFGFRMPDFPFLQKILKKLNYPLWATSANLSGENDSLSFDKVLKNLSKKVDLAIKNDNFLNQASTVIRIKNNEFDIVRKGTISKEQLKKVLKN